MTSIDELTRTLLDQVEKLNDDTICEDMEKAKVLVDRSRAMGELSSRIIDIERQKTDEQRLKLDIVKTLSENGGIYEKYLGIPDAKRIAK